MISSGIPPAANAGWRPAEVGRKAESMSHLLAAELLDKAWPVAAQLTDPCPIPQLRGQARVRCAGIFKLPDPLGPIRGRGDSGDETLWAERSVPVDESSDRASKVRFIELMKVLALVGVRMMAEPRETDDVDTILLLARCAVATNSNETVDVYRQRYQQFLGVLPVLQRGQFRDLAVQDGWLLGKRRE
jgi:hypothetical protein